MARTERTEDGGLPAAPARPTPADGPGAPAPTRRAVVTVVVGLVVGAALLGWSLAIDPGDPTFILATSLMTVTWGGAALVAGGLRLGGPAVGWARRLPRPLLQPAVLGALTGLAMVAVFTAGALVVDRIPVLRDAVAAVLDHRQANLPAVVAVALATGVAEELYFRGALFDVVRRHHPVLVTSVVYTVTTIATGNVMLVFSAALLGTVCAVLRRATGGVLASALTHCVWSAGMLVVLPLLLR